MLLNSVELDSLEQELKVFTKSGTEPDFNANLNIIVNNPEEYEDVLIPIQYSAYL